MNVHQSIPLMAVVGEEAEGEVKVEVKVETEGGVSTETSGNAPSHVTLFDEEEEDHIPPDRLIQELMRAAVEGNETRLCGLVRKGVRIDGRDDAGRTPFHHAARHGLSEAVNLMLRRGADQSSKDHDGWTPVHHAANSGCVECLRLLINAKADLNAKDSKYFYDYGNTPLHMASASGYVECVQLLVDNGAKIWLWNSQGNSPLHLAAEKGRFECVKLLIERGANTASKNQKGQTPLDLGANAQIRDFLQAAGTKGASQKETDALMPGREEKDDGHCCTLS